MKGILKKIMSTVLIGALMISVFVGRGIEVKAANYVFTVVNGTDGYDYHVQKPEVLKKEETIGRGDSFSAKLSDNFSKYVSVEHPYLAVWADDGTAPNGKGLIWYNLQMDITNDKKEFTYLPVTKDIVEEYSKYKGISYKSVKIKNIYYAANDKQCIIMVVEGHEITPNTESNVEKSSKASVSSVEKTAHTHSYSWNVVTEATESGDGLELLQCSCGDVQAKSVIPASQAYVSKFRDLVKNAPANGTVTYDSKMNHTFSDYIIKRLAERNDVTTVIDFKWQNKDYTLTIPAGIDYTAILADDIEFYGYLYFAQLTGATVVAK